jgi:hypothetical protein
MTGGGASFYCDLKTVSKALFKITEVFGAVFFFEAKLS